MDLRKDWKALKAKLCEWFYTTFGSASPDNSRHGTSAGNRNRTDAQDSQVTQVTIDNLVVTVCERLEHLRRKRMFAIRKKANRMEWLVSHADFTDAYLFLLSIPGADISRLGHRRAADSITYRMELSFGVAAELTDDTRQEDTIAVLRLMTDGRCMLKINFINDIKN